MMPRLLLLDVEPCEYPAIIIIACPVTDGAGNFVTGNHSQTEGERTAQRYADKYGKPFWAGNVKVMPGKGTP